MLTIPGRNWLKIWGSAHTVIGRYERDEMKPTIDVVKKLAEALDTTVGFLLGEAKDTNILNVIANT